MLAQASFEGEAEAPQQAVAGLVVGIDVGVEAAAPFAAHEMIDQRRDGLAGDAALIGRRGTRPAS